ncbi:MAG: SAM-dependent methyltransferase [Holophagaceae bacterium]|nr:SAM-dependent methyltransferase [Holophagaceae bacterium]
MDVADDAWGAVEARIELDAIRFGPEALAGLSDFSHLLVVYHFHLADPRRIETSARHPRNNPAWPKVGIFAQRGKNRPNGLGVSVCEILGVDGTTIHVRGLDAVDGTPVLDLKPHMKGFEPRGEVREPAWATELMGGYW